MSASNGNRLTPEEVNRYSRHVTLPEVGVSGQEKLKAASILSIGAGGLGSPIGIYLAAAVCWIFINPNGTLFDRKKAKS